MWNKSPVVYSGIKLSTVIDCDWVLNFTASFYEVLKMKEWLCVVPVYLHVSSPTQLNGFPLKPIFTSSELNMPKKFTFFSGCLPTKLFPSHAFSVTWNFRNLQHCHSPKIVPWVWIRNSSSSSLHVSSPTQLNGFPLKPIFTSSELNMPKKFKFFSGCLPTKLFPSHAFSVTWNFRN